MTLINTIDKIVIWCKWTTTVYFWHFLANVSCRISRASGGFATLPPPWFCPGFVWGLKTSASDLQLQGGHCMLCLQQNIHTSCNLQTTGSGKHINFDEKTQGKMDGNHQKLRENSGKMMLKILYEPWLISLCRFAQYDHQSQRTEMKLSQSSALEL